MTKLILNIDDYPNACCGTCKHNKTCDNFLTHKERTEWICGLYQNGGSAIKQLDLFGEDYERKL